MNERLAKILKLGATGALLASGVAFGFAGGARADTTFPQTGFTVWGPFEQYWNTHGGMAQFGLPRTSVYPVKPATGSTGSGYDAQWFERALFTYNPNNPDPFKVQLQLLGNLITSNRKSQAPFQRKPAGLTPGGTYFEQTGHNLTGKFLEYWKAHGGLAIYGYPISEAFTEKSKSDGKEYAVQYFERNRLEYHPELAGTPYEIQLGLLGSELLDQQGGVAAFSNLGNPLFYPPRSGTVVPPGGVIPIGTPVPDNQVPVPDAPSLPSTSSRVLFQADFASPDLSAWVPLAPLGGPGAVPAKWTTGDGQLLQSGIASADDTDDEAFLITRDRSFSDFRLDTYYYATSGDPVGVVFGYSDTGYYLLKLFPAGMGGSEPKAILYKTGAPNGGLATLNQSTSFDGYKLGTWQLLTVTSKGSSISVQVDGATVLSAQDASAPLESGGIGLYTMADGATRFDNFRVVAMSSP